MHPRRWQCGCRLQKASGEHVIWMKLALASPDVLTGRLDARARTVREPGLHELLFFFCPSSSLFLVNRTKARPAEAESHQAVQRAFCSRQLTDEDRPQPICGPKYRRPRRVSVRADTQWRSTRLELVSGWFTTELELCDLAGQLIRVASLQAG